MAPIITSTRIPKKPDPRDTGRWRRAAVIAGALAYAALAIGNGLDRLAYALPGAARHIPAPFAVNALEVVGEAALRNDPDAALVLAQRLVAAAPIEPSSTALLGASRAAVGDDDGAMRAFRVAGQLGWRIPLTQSYWLDQALAAGDLPVAARRLDALLRIQPQRLRIPATLAPFESDPAAQAALVDRLATRPPWLNWYTGEIDPVPADVLARRVPALVMLADRGIVLGCTAIAPAMRQLLGAGQAAPAEALRHRHCPAAANP
jgi:hypothetical protein